MDGASQLINHRYEIIVVVHLYPFSSNLILDTGERYFSLNYVHATTENKVLKEFYVAGGIVEDLNPILRKNIYQCKTSIKQLVGPGNTRKTLSVHAACSLYGMKAHELLTVGYCAVASAQARFFLESLTELVLDVSYL